MVPSKLKYSDTHEWAKIDDDTAVVGITDHAQSELGDIVYLELPEVGSTVEKGDVFGTLESVKTVSDLISPVSGEITEANSELSDTPEVINNEPYEGGWLVKIKLSNPAEVNTLMDADAYEQFIQEH
ncbi:MAG TPA: glycine cleavage system protein GcvH [Armatimonadetes bacterium]|jgi:glycine cleavage system H protein|nr:glycine cleavage system protein GcvH [Armatimonadota bacterium]